MWIEHFKIPIPDSRYSADVTSGLTRVKYCHVSLWFMTFMCLKFWNSLTPIITRLCHVSLSDVSWIDSLDHMLIWRFRFSQDFLHHDFGVSVVIEHGTRETLILDSLMSSTQMAPDPLPPILANGWSLFLRDFETFDVSIHLSLGTLISWWPISQCLTRILTHVLPRSMARILSPISWWLVQDFSSAH